MGDINESNCSLSEALLKRGRPLLVTVDAVPCFSFQVGKGEVIEGWDLGVVGISDSFYVGTVPPSEISDLLNP